MDNRKSESIPALPDEMLSFVLAQFEVNSLGPRLGQLLRNGRAPLQTPHYIATTSRGVVPHISHDVLQRHTSIRGAYIALEDCTLRERLTPQLTLTLGLQKLYSHRKGATKCPDISHADPSL
jgi:hypothetical protein